MRKTGADGLRLCQGPQQPRAQFSLEAGVIRTQQFCANLDGEPVFDKRNLILKECGVEVVRPLIGHKGKTRDDFEFMAATGACSQAPAEFMALR
jgi:hypothetical protein